MIVSRLIDRNGFLKVGALSLLFLLANFVEAQGQFGQITGVIADPSGSGIVGANVTVSNQQTGVQIKSVTNSDGNYTVTSLVPGVYQVVASKAGFQSLTQTGIQLDVSQTARIDITLQLGQVNQQVEVKASGVLLQTESAAIGNVVPQSGVVDLPLNGRNYLQLATLVPGTSSAGIGQQSFGLPTNNLNVNGMRSSATAYVIDGADVMEQFNSGTPYTPPPDAIQEFRVETNNMTAQYGGGGAILNVVLKSGTNKFHGVAYDFLRNNALDARNFFAATNPELRQNQFGAALGGPIKRDKLFFFVDYQGTRIRDGQTFNSVVPTAAQRAGDFSGLPQLTNPANGLPLANNQVPSSGLSPQASYFLKFIPLPNTAGGTYVQTVPGSNDVDQYDIRVDYQVRPEDVLTFSFSQQRGSTFTPGPFPLNGATSGPNQGEFTNLGWNHTFGATLVNQAHVSYARNTGYETGQGIGTNYTEQAGIGGFEQTSIAYPGPPQLTISGYSNVNGYGFLPLGQIYNHYNVGDLVSKVAGKHTIQLGGDARWYDGFNYNGAHSRGAFTFTGVYTGDSFADFLYGLPFQGQRTFPRNLFGNYQRNQALFVQDTWKVTPRLTVVGGFRWDLIHPNTYLNNTYASTNPVTNQIIVASNSQGQINTQAQQVTEIVLPLFQSLIVPSSKAGLPNSLVHTDWHAFAPRLGLAYQPGHNFVIRAGYGIFYPLTQGNQQVSTGIVNPPFIVDELSNFNTTPVPTKTLANMFPPSSSGAFALTPPSFFQINPTQPDPYIQEWNFALQKSIGQALSLQAAYVGSKGTDLTFSLPINIPAPGPGAIQANRPNTFFSGGNYLSNDGTSSYNALQLTAETRAWRGLYLLASYTWGKSMDNQSGDDQGSPVQDPANVRNEWAVSDSNIKSRFTMASTYQLPLLGNRAGWVRNLLGGWSLSNIITLQTGPVFTPTIATDPANTGTTQRPNQVGNGALANPTIDDWFDVSAFAVPALYTYGNSARNVLTGPGLKDWDFGLFKSFALPHLWEQARLQFRGEFFNFTNTAPFGLPVTNIQSAAAGKILSAGAPRIVQVSLKLYF